MDTSEYLQNWRSQLNRGLLEHLVLLLVQKPRHGYEILQLLRSNVATTQDMADGPLYALFSRMKKKSIISEDIKEVDGRMRKYLQITDQGQEILNLMNKDWLDLNIAIEQFNELSKK